MSRKFIRSIQKAATFTEWLERLKRFNCALIKENNLQMWTMEHYRACWIKAGRTI